VKTKEESCPSCDSRHVKKNGTTRQDKQRYRCQECGKSFLFCLHYTYRACSRLWRELIVPMTLNSSGVRDTARVLRISPNTVLSVLRKAAAEIPEPRVPPRIKELEIDEQWSFVHDKKQQNWHWYALNRRTGRIAAFFIGRRTDQSCRQLCQKLAPCDVLEFYTDQWKSYSKFIDPQFHFIGKTGTQNIERKNLNFRTHLKRLQRKTIGFSKSTQMHYNVLKLYIHALNSKQHHF